MARPQRSLEVAGRKRWPSRRAHAGLPSGKRRVEEVRGGEGDPKALCRSCSSYLNSAIALVPAQMVPVAVRVPIERALYFKPENVKGEPIQLHTLRHAGNASSQNCRMKATEDLSSTRRTVQGERNHCRTTVPGHMSFG
eukprot:4800730-Amphidinium_carterae.1